jgi:cobalt/nickel transport system permease protein
MHIPDGFLDVNVLAVTGAVSAAVVAFSAWQVNKKTAFERIPLMGICATFIFTVQLISFPLGLTSVHINGSVLISILLGPFSGILITTAAMIIHALLQHGGILTLGANVFNIGVVGCLAGYFIYYILPKRLFIGAAFAAWLAIGLSALACALELQFSGKLPPGKAVIGLVGIYLIIGIVEAAVTFVIITTVNQMRPDLLKLPKI